MVDKRTYKETEVGKIPLEWRVAMIREIGDVKMCRRIFSYQTTMIGEIPFYKIGTFGKEPDAFISKLLYHQYRLKYSFPKKGDILISAAGTIGRTSVYNGEDAYFQDSNIVWVDNKSQIVSNEYLNYVYQIIKYKTEGGTIQRLYNNILLNAAFPLPPLEEQKAIAEVLSDVDELIAQTERLIAKKEAIKTGVMQELLRPKEGWSTYLVDDVAVVQGGGTPSTSITEYWGGQINWFTPTEVGSKKYLVESERKITEKGLSRSSAKVLPAGTILFTSRAGIGDLGILTNEAATNQGFQSLIVKTDFHNEFIYYLLQTKKSEFLKYSSGSTFLEISPTSLKSVLLETPTKEKQHQIAQAISDIDEELLAMEAKAEKYRQLKSALMDQLLTGKTRLV